MLSHGGGTTGLDDNEELFKKMAHGHFTLRDMYEQFVNIQKLGPFGQLMEMIPGMGGGLLGPEGEKESAKCDPLPSDYAWAVSHQSLSQAT